MGGGFTDGYVTLDPKASLGTIGYSYDSISDIQDKKIDNLNQQIIVLKRLLIMKNLCTEEEINDILNSVNIEEKLIQK